MVLSAFTLAAFLDLSVSAADLKAVETVIEESYVIDHIDGIADNDDLFAGYVDQLFYGTGEQETMLHASSIDSSYNALDEKSKRVFDYLRLIVAKIASGQESSAVIEIPLSVLGCPTTKQYTAAELGLTDILDGGKISKAAQTAMSNELSFDYEGVKDQLLADCPYELYWFDKTKGMTIGGAMGLLGNANTISFTEATKVTVSMKVSSDFSIAGDIDRLTVDKAKTGAASTAATNAQAVVSQYASASDLKKLEGFKNYITENTSYNNDAAESTTPSYGNPWQLIWVFDGDPETTVVCEGYSKAFKYLCDASSFLDKTIACYIVTGNMGAEGHMWDLVRINGTSYLVDITNSDAGMAGQNGELFLAGSSAQIENGYTLSAGSKTINYVYDSSTLSTYTSSVLVISSTGFYGEVTTYNLWVGGRQVTNLNASNIPAAAGETKTGIASYDAENNILTLTDYCYSGRGNAIRFSNSTENAVGMACICYGTYSESESKSLTINLNGTNSLCQTGVSDSSLFSSGIYSAGSLEITGSGSLSSTGGKVVGNNSSYGIYCFGNSFELNSGTLTAEGGESSSESCGIYCYSMTVNGGELTASCNNNSQKSYGIEIPSSGDLFFRFGTLLSAGGTQAVYGNIRSLTDGLGWNNVEGTAGQTFISRSSNDSDTHSYSYKRIVFSNEIKATISGYTGVYDGSGHGISISVTDPNPELATVMYKKDLSDARYELTQSPEYVDAGTYTVYYQITAYGYTTKTGSETITINKADPTFTTEPAAIPDLIYNGAVQNLVTTGTASGGTVQYAIQTDSSSSPTDSAFSDSVPSATEAGTYYVYYRIEGNSNYNSVSAQDPISAVISPKQITASVTLTDTTAIIYDGTPKQPDVTVKDEDTIIDGNEYTVSYSNNTNAGTATVTITDKDGGNYTVSGGTTFSISKKTITGAVVTLSAEQLPYNGSEQSVSVSSVVLDGVELGTEDYAVSGSLSGTDKGTYTVTVEGQGNYEGSASASWRITDKLMTVSAENVVIVYDGSPHSIIVSVTDPSTGYSVNYGRSEGTYDLVTAPAITDVNDSPLTVYYQVTADSNETFCGSATVCITQKPVSVKAKDQTINEGTAITSDVSQAELDGAVEGHTLSSITLTAGSTSENSSITPSLAKIIDSSGTDVTRNYSFTYNPGVLTVTRINRYTVTFRVINGAWDDGTSADKTVTLTGPVGELLYLASGHIPSVGSRPAALYREGGWDSLPSAGENITADRIYTYTYVKDEQYNNGNNDGNNSGNNNENNGNNNGDNSGSSGTITPPAQTEAPVETGVPAQTEPVAAPPAPQEEPITILKAPSSVKAKATKNKVTISWKKIKKTKKTKELLSSIRSIQIQYSTDPAFKQDVVNKSVGKNKTKVVLKLQKKKTYYIRVRYVGNGGVSRWSGVKVARTK